MTFDERIEKAIAETKNECHYNPKAFIQMVETYGAKEAVKRLLASKQNISSGLEKLWELGRLDLCFERIIFEPEWHDMFTKEELTEAKKRLKDLNYNVSELSVEPLGNSFSEEIENSTLFNLTDNSFLIALNDGNVLHDSDKPLLECFYKDSEYTQSAPQLAEKLGYSDIGPVNALIGKFAKRIAEFYGVVLERERNSPGWWRVIADGKDVNGTFFWTLKPAFVKALNEYHFMETPPTYWLLPSNEKNYDVEKAFLKYHTIDWHQTNNQIAVNDIVYIYETKPQQVVRFTCLVTAVNKKFANKKDRDCYKDSTPFENKGCYMTLKFQRRFEDVLPDMAGLEANGVPVVRRVMKVPEKALAYIQNCDKDDREAQRFDGTIPSDIPVDHWSLVGGDEEELREQAENESKGLSDSELYAKATQQGTVKPKERATTTSTYVRNTYVAEASKRRAKGICQLCGNPAPFVDKNGNPYLESHHIIWLSEGGADVLENTAALCPNCHKKMHIVNDAEDVKKLKELNK